MGEWLDPALDAVGNAPLPGLPQGINRTRSALGAVGDVLGVGGDVVDDKTRNQILASQVAKKYGIPESIFIGLMGHESGNQWDPKVGHDNPDGGWVSWTGVLESTGKGLGYTKEELAKDPAKGLEAAAKYLQKNNKYFNGDWQKTTASYFIGEGGVDQAMSMGGDWLKNADVIAQKYGQGSVTDYLKSVGGGVAANTDLRSKTPEQIRRDLNFPSLGSSTTGPLKNYNPAKLPSYGDFLVGTGSDAYFDKDSFEAALKLHQQYAADDKSAYERSVGPMSQYVDDIVSEYSAQIAAGKLTTEKATNLFNARTKSMEIAQKSYEGDAFKYAAPSTGQYLPGREPGGMWEKMGLAPKAADRSTTLNPLADAAAAYDTYKTGLDSVTTPAVPDIANMRRNALILASGGGTTYPFGSSPPTYGPPTPTGPAPAGPGPINTAQSSEQSLLEQLLKAGIGAY